MIPSGPGGLLHYYSINYNMLETLLPNNGLIRRILSRKVGLDISSILGMAFIGFTLTQTCTTVWRHVKHFASRCTSWVTSSITLRGENDLALDVGAWAAEHIASGYTRYLAAGSSRDSSFYDEDDYQGLGNYPGLVLAKPPASRGSDKFDDATCKRSLLRIYTLRH